MAHPFRSRYRNISARSCSQTMINSLSSMAPESLVSRLSNRLTTLSLLVGGRLLANSAAYSCPVQATDHHTRIYNRECIHIYSLWLEWFLLIHSNTRIAAVTAAAFESLQSCDHHSRSSFKNIIQEYQCGKPSWFGLWRYSPGCSWAAAASLSITLALLSVVFRSR